MNRVAFAIACLVLARLTATQASASELNLATTSTARPSIFLLRTGVDHAIVSEVGYRRVLLWGERQVFVGGDVAVPWGSLDLRDYRVRLGAGLPVVGGQHWKLAGWLSPTVRGTRNAGSDMIAVGTDVHLTGGYYAQRWFLAGEVGIDWVAATHITMSDAYRSQGYAAARDGWYASAGGTAYTGLLAGLSFSSVDVVLRAGLPRGANLSPQTLPAYLTLGVNTSLPW